MTAQHPSTRRSSSGFAGLRLVSGPHEVESGADEPFEVRVCVVDGRVGITWDPDSEHVLRDVVEVIRAAVMAIDTDEDVDLQVQRTYERTRAWREAREENARVYVETHPWLCACGRRCKTSGGLTNHRNAGGPRCV